MSEASNPPTPIDAVIDAVPVEALLAHRQWVRSLARSLVRDESSADDVEQRTWEAALTAPPRKLSALRAWLGSVVRRTVLDSQRRHVRRERRERAAARPEMEPAAGDVVARAEIDRHVVNAVTDLPEPYRTTLLLRFYDGRPPRDVAKRMGVPVETVRARVRRGLERVRGGLDDSHDGNRDAWKAALVPFLAWPAGALGGGDAVGDAVGETVREAAASGGSAGTAGAPAGGGVGGLTSTLIASAAALVIGALAAQRLTQDREPPAEPPELISARHALQVEALTLRELQAQVASLSGQLMHRARAARETVAELVETKAAIDAATAARDQALASTAASPAEPTVPFVRRMRFPDYDAALDAVDWTALAEHLGALIPLLGEVFDDKTAGRTPSPEAVGQVQVHNGWVVALVLPLEDAFPGSGANTAFTHPSFVATAVAALCHFDGVALTPEQVTAIDRLAKDASDDVARVTLGADRPRFRLRAMIEESRRKGRFLRDVRAALTPAQRALFGRDEVVSAVAYDLLGPGLLWVTSVETPRFPDRASAVARLAPALRSKLGIPQGLGSEVTRVVEEWVESLPGELIQRPADPVESTPTELVIEAAEHMLRLLDGLASLDLTAESRADIRDCRAVLLLRCGRKPNEQGD